MKRGQRDFTQECPPSGVTLEQAAGRGARPDAAHPPMQSLTLGFSAVKRASRFTDREPVGLPSTRTPFPVPLAHFPCSLANGGEQRAGPRCGRAKTPTAVAPPTLPPPQSKADPANALPRNISFVCQPQDDGPGTHFPPHQSDGVRLTAHATKRARALAGTANVRRTRTARTSGFLSAAWTGPAQPAPPAPSLEASRRS